MDFYTLSNGEDFIYNPYAGKQAETWIEGYTSVEFLNAIFGQYTTATEMKNVTTSEGLKLFFDYLVSLGQLPE